MNEDNKMRIAQLKQYFSTITDLPETLSYNAYTTITDVPRFIQSHISFVENDALYRVSDPYLERLKDVKEKLSALKTEKPKKTRKKSKQT